jgi:hypothetical protein
MRSAEWLADVSAALKEYSSAAASLSDACDELTRVLETGGVPSAAHALAAADARVILAGAHRSYQEVRARHE